MDYRFYKEITVTLNGVPIMDEVIDAIKKLRFEADSEGCGSSDVGADQRNAW